MTVVVALLTVLVVVLVAVEVVSVRTSPVRPGELNHPTSTDVEDLDNCCELEEELEL